jgi:protein O-mannosyl-transferase
MGKKNKLKARKIAVATEAPPPPPPQVKVHWYTFNGFTLQAILLVVIGLICFGNTFYNEYALDDDVIIIKNQFVQQGVKGIPAIMSSDALASFYNQYGGEQQLSGGRYRPLSIVTFAIEQQFLDTTIEADAQLLTGKKTVHPSAKITHERHGVNVVLYILSVLLLLYFLRNFIFKEQPLIPFIACLLFLIHPIHTEVVANIKSRDEIFSFLFFMLTFIQAFRYYETKHKKDLYWALFFYLLAFLSKEYAITILVLLPMLFYIVKKDSLSKSIARVIPFLAVAVGYIILRSLIIGTGSNTENQDLLNNPFLYATNIERLATKIEILDRYLWLLIHPTVLSSDYSYNTIPYVDFSNGMVWLSLVILIGMVVAAIVLFRKRNILSFALAFYLLHLFLVSNLVFDLGATMGERLIYHSSLGFVLIIAIGINCLLQKINQPVVKQTILVAGCLAIVYWCAANDIRRNAQWKNNATLYMTDVKAVPNSVFSNGNAGEAMINASEKAKSRAIQLQMLDSAIFYLKRALAIHDKFVNGYLNLGYAYVLKGDYDKAKENWDIAKSIFPTNPFLAQYYSIVGSAYSNKGIELLKSAQPHDGVILFEKAVACEPDNIDFLNNLGMGYYFVDKLPEKARQQWEKSLRIKPANKVALDGMALFNKK